MDDKGKEAVGVAATDEGGAGKLQSKKGGVAAVITHRYRPYSQYTGSEFTM
jgi:hypothetical protein